jgi:hypothetical protein
MRLVEILLPITWQTRAELERLMTQLTDRFGGATAFVRSPGEGLWQDESSIVRDEVVVVEVMCETIDHAWWRRLREDLETRLGEKEIVVRAHAVERL